MRNFTFFLSGLMIAGLFFLTAQTASAQMGYSSNRTTFGVKVGPNFSNITVKDANPKPKIIVRLQGGVYANIPIAPQFYVQPSLLYEGKGAKAEEQEATTNMRLNYLTLPIDVLFKPEMPNGSGSWIVGVGPYLGYGMSGKMKFENVGEGDNIDIDPFKKGELAEGVAILKRFDAGANVQLGYEMANGFNITLDANLGLIDISGDDSNDDGVSIESGTIKNTSFGITLGYTLK